MALVVLPKALIADTPARAADVTADLNAILAQVNGGLDNENLKATILQALFAPGDLKFVAYAAAPTGWLLCNGQAVSRVTYAALFAKIGTVYGKGDNVTTFNVPDWRGRFALGVDSGANRVTNVGGGGGTANLGSSGGSQFMPTHGHDAGGLGTSIESSTHTHNFDGFINTRREGNLNAYNNWDGTPGSGFSNTGTEGSFHTHAITGRTANEGSGSSGNVPPFQTGNWLIKT